MKVTSINACPGVKTHQVFKLNPDSNLTLTEDCRVLTYGCIEWEAFNSANTTFNLLRNGRAVQKKNCDLCNQTQHTNLYAVLSGFGLSETCPTPAVG